MDGLWIFAAGVLCFDAVLVVVYLAHDRQMRAFNKGIEEANERRKANRTPKEIDDEGRAACIAMCGFDPGPSQQKGEACS